MRFVQDVEEENLSPSLPTLQDVIQRSALLAELNDVEDHGIGDPLNFDWEIDDLVKKHYG